MVHKKKESDFKTIIFQDNRTVFSLNELALLLNESNFKNIKQKVNYYVHNRVLKNVRRGIYAKTIYNAEELAAKIFVPSYISLEYVLQKSGVIFQYSEQLTLVSYLSRSVSIDQKKFIFRKIKNEILLNTLGVTRNHAGLNIATPERAFLDTLYLNKRFFFDNPTNLDRSLIEKLSPIYCSKILNSKIKEVLG